MLKEISINEKEYDGLSFSPLMDGLGSPKIVNDPFDVDNFLNSPTNFKPQSPPSNNYFSFNQQVPIVEKGSNIQNKNSKEIIYSKPIPIRPKKKRDHNYDDDFDTKRRFTTKNFNDERNNYNGGYQNIDLSSTLIGNILQKNVGSQRSKNNGLDYSSVDLGDSYLSSYLSPDQRSHQITPKIQEGSKNIDLSNTFFSDIFNSDSNDLTQKNNIPKLKKKKKKFSPNININNNNTNFNGNLNNRIWSFKILTDKFKNARFNITYKTRREARSRYVDSTLYSSLRYEVSVEIGGDFKEHVFFPVHYLVARISVIDPISFKKIIRSEPVLTGQTTISLTNQSGTGIMSGTFCVKFKGLSYYHEKKEFSWGIEVFDRDDMNHPVVLCRSPSFKIFARKPSKKRKRKQNVRMENTSNIERDAPLKKKNTLDSGVSSNFIKFRTAFLDCIEYGKGVTKKEEKEMMFKMFQEMLGKEYALTVKKKDNNPFNMPGYLKNVKFNFK